MIIATVIDVISDSNGNIQVTTDYKDEKGKLIQRGTTRYSYSVSDNQKDIEDRIKKDIDDHCNNMMVRLHYKNKNSSGLESLKSSILGYSSSKEAVEVKRGNRILTVSESKVIDTKDA